MTRSTGIGVGAKQFDTGVDSGVEVGNGGGRNGGGRNGGGRNGGGRNGGGRNGGVDVSRISFYYNTVVDEKRLGGRILMHDETVEGLILKGLNGKQCVEYLNAARKGNTKAPREAERSSY